METLLAISFTAVLGAATASMMSAVATGLSSKDDGRKIAIRLATSKNRLSSYIAPSRCILDNRSSIITLWIEDTRKSNTVHASEIRWIQFNQYTNELTVEFVSFPEQWSEQMVENADIECSVSTNYKSLLWNFKRRGLIGSFPLIDSIASFTFWTNDPDPFKATMVSARYSLQVNFGKTSEAMIDESIRHHSPPLE